MNVWSILIFPFFLISMPLPFGIITIHNYGHVECSNGAVKTAFDIQADGKRGPGSPKMTWKQLTEGLQRVEALGYQPS